MKGQRELAFIEDACRWLERSAAVLTLPKNYLNKQPAVGVPHESGITLEKWLAFFTPLSGGAQ